MLIISNNRVACTPFATTQAKVEVKGGIATIKQRAELTSLKVVYPAERAYVADEVVWVRGEACKQPFAREVFEVEEGKPFILVPLEFIVAWEPMRKAV